MRTTAPAAALSRAINRDDPYTRLVPASLLPPEDPAAALTRTLRDWVVDVLMFLAAVGFGVLFYAGATERSAQHVATPWRLLDLGLGVLAALSLWGRRRWPTGVGVFTALCAVLSATASPASIAGLFGVAVHRRTGTALAVAVLNVATATVFLAVRPQNLSFLVSSILNVGFAGVFAAWGMFVRARRQLVWTLRARAERAEAEQELQAEQARRAERTRIAREMHDVLAHRISMIALHAGGLEVRPDLQPDEVRETAGLLRTTARLALEELRGVIGVLRAEDDPTSDGAAPPPPQPTLRDIPRLVADTRQAGARIDFAMDVPDDADLPVQIGRDAYRIVQEALTNVAKHARGTSTVVRIAGSRGSGLRVDVRNKLPVTQPTGATLPGSGTGLVGLRERVTLAGGTIEHGPTESGEFAVDARLAW